MISLTASIEAHLKQRLKKILPGHSTDQVYEYALFPCGKLIRSQLCLALAQDLTGNLSPKHLQVASFLEFHHAYTLIHDDLPCMDNDDYRRGKPTTHKAFNEWKALLAGDGLLIASLGELVEINSPHQRSMLRFAQAYTGPKGLILGQILDLNQEMNLSIENLIRTHQLKTARLFQLSFILSYYATLHAPASMREIWFYHQLGNDLGIIFQLLDDLVDLTSEKVSGHEEAINPFLIRSIVTTKLFQQKISSLQSHLQSRNLTAVKKVLIDNYFSKTMILLRQNEKILKERVQDYLPIKLVLDSFQL